MLLSRQILTLALVGATPLFAQTPAPFDVEEATISQVHEAMKAGRLTCRDLVDQYLKRIDLYDKNGPAINAIVLVNPDARKEAAELDRRFAQSGLTGPLHCVPMIVKDNFETRGLRTTNGALAFASYIPAEDAFLVKRVTEAGALVLAKSNMAEWAFSPYGRSVRSCPGIRKTRMLPIGSQPDRAVELRQPWPRALASQAWEPIPEIPSAGLPRTRLWPVSVPPWD